MPKAFATSSRDLIVEREALTAASEAQTQTSSQVIAQATAQSCPSGLSARQQEMQRLASIGASEEEINFVRFCPATFDPVKPVICAGGMGAAAQASFATLANLDHSCFANFQGSTPLDQFGADVQDELDGIEAEINRTDENLANIRDEARSGLRSGLSDIFGLIPGGRFIKFVFFAIIAIVVLIVLRLLFGLFRRG